MIDEYADKTLDEILVLLEKKQPEIDRILNRPSFIETGRKKKILCQIPSDLDFTEKDGNTVYEVTGHFNPDAKEDVFCKISRFLSHDVTGTD